MESIDRKVRNKVIVTLVKNGYKYQEIADKFGIKRQMVGLVIKGVGLSMQDFEESRRSKTNFYYKFLKDKIKSVHQEQKFTRDSDLDKDIQKLKKMYLK